MRLVTEKRNFMFIKSEMKPIRRTISGSQGSTENREDLYTVDQSHQTGRTGNTASCCLDCLQPSLEIRETEVPMTIVMKERTLNVKDAAARLTAGVATHYYKTRRKRLPV